MTGALLISVDGLGNGLSKLHYWYHIRETWAVTMSLVSLYSSFHWLVEHDFYPPEQSKNQAEFDSNPIKFCLDQVRYASRSCTSQEGWGKWTFCEGHQGVLARCVRQHFDQYELSGTSHLLMSGNALVHTGR